MRRAVYDVRARPTKHSRYEQNNRNEYISSSTLLKFVEDDGSYRTNGSVVF